MNKAINVAIRDRFRTEPVTVARVYIDADEGFIANDLDHVVAAYPTVKIGSYPRFSEKDFKVLVTMMFRGRQMAHTEIGRALLAKFAAAVEDIAKVEMPPRQEGYRMQMTLACGCHLTRPIGDLIERNGFRFQTVRRFFAPKMPRTHGWITAGIALPAERT